MTDFSLIYTLIIIAAIFGVILNTVAYLVLLERKISAWVQDRVGPNRVGPWGLLQPIADGIKMFLKEDIIPKHVDKVFYVIAPGISVCTALLAFTVVPFGPTQAPPEPVAITATQPFSKAMPIYQEQLKNYQQEYSFVIAPGLDIGILLTYAIGSLAVYGIILGGWSGNNKYSLLGSLRSSAQIISYEIPLGLSILGLILYTGSFNLEKIIDYQITHGWFFFYQPLAFIIFMTAVFAECNRLPFDLPEAEQELVGGYHTEYSSMKLGFLLLGEYVHMMTTSFLMAILFFGGWHFPGLSDLPGLLGVAMKFAIVAGKMGIFILVYMLVRWTIPRFRFDQLMGLAWQVMIPLALANLVCVLFVREFDLSPWLMTIVSIALFALFAVLSLGGDTMKENRKKVFKPSTLAVATK
jgi:NADH-quinone oxidoreductase subunit H